ncbi:MAG TPA: methyltransferase domain-containing protein [Reyranellaceae bacterium]|nr:methyltransferase domain-containing protein [Reyranellaceae bacterium]
MNDAVLSRFGAEYARHRESEGRRHSAEELLQLPYLRSGPLARQWSVRARSFEAFVDRVLRPERERRGRPLILLDLGAGNGWLSHRAALDGDQAIAIDIRADCVDGLGAAEMLARRVPGRMECLQASFDALPLADGSADIAVFNASLHYSTSLEATLAEAARVVRRGGRIVILDSPFYRDERDGLAMVAEKKAGAGDAFGERAEALLALPFIEFLTRERLRLASRALSLEWTRHRVTYPLWYELRPLRAALTGRRRPSRFDLWVAERP